MDTAVHWAGKLPQAAMTNRNCGFKPLECWARAGLTWSICQEMVSWKVTGLPRAAPKASSRARLVLRGRGALRALGSKLLKASIRFPVRGEERMGTQESAASVSAGTHDCQASQEEQEVGILSGAVDEPVAQISTPGNG